MNPYEQLGSQFFWSSAVAKKNMFDIGELWIPKFEINQKNRVATYGSCFAQHIGRALKKNGFSWYVTETAPKGVNADTAKQYNYDIFSARTGNIYTSSLLKQWAEWAAGDVTAPTEVWEKDGRFFDPFRPAIEPNGFESEEELLQSRSVAIDAFKRSVLGASTFVFTMGLTESWFNSVSGHEYPMCPGTVAGTFDPLVHKFHNQDYAQIRAATVQAIRLLRRINPRLKILLTVSPVPLTATLSGKHVLVATMESKAILRAVAGELSRAMAIVDYFPSYEIINGTPYRGGFFEPNQRTVNHVGVDHVMSNFFKCLEAKFPGSVSSVVNVSASDRSRVRLQSGQKRQTLTNLSSKQDEVCEELLLNAFAIAAKGV